MRKINIEITKAQLESFTIGFDVNEDKIVPEVSASLGLLTENGKKISQYSISSGKWANNKFTLPIEMFSPIMEIAEQLEVIVTKHCRENQLSLNAPKND